MTRANPTLFPPQAPGKLEDAAESFLCELKRQANRDCESHQPQSTLSREVVPSHALVVGLDRQSLQTHSLGELGRDARITEAQCQKRRSQSRARKGREGEATACWRVTRLMSATIGRRSSQSKHARMPALAPILVAAQPPVASPPTPPRQPHARLSRVSSFRRLTGRRRWLFAGPFDCHDPGRGRDSVGGKVSSTGGVRLFMALHRNVGWMIHDPSPMVRSCQPQTRK